MAQAESASTTVDRRSLFRLAGAATGFAIAGGVMAVQPDGELLAMCREIMAAEGVRGVSEEEMDAVIDRQTAMIRRVETMQASTVVGLLAKLQVLNIVGDLSFEPEEEFPQSVRRVFLSALADAERLAMS